MDCLRFGPVCRVNPLSSVLVLLLCVSPEFVMFQSSTVGSRQCRVSAVEPGSMLQVVYTRADSASCVSV